MAQGTIVDSDGSTVTVKMSSATDGSEWTISTDGSTLTQSGDKFEKNQGESEGARMVSFTAQNSGNQIITATDGDVTITVEATIKDGKVTALKGSDTEGYAGEVK